MLTVAGLTLLFASNSPALHSLYTVIQHPPPAALLNAGAGVVAAVGMLGLGDFFNSLAACLVIVKVRLLPCSLTFSRAARRSSSVSSNACSLMKSHESHVFRSHCSLSCHFGPVGGRERRGRTVHWQRRPSGRAQSSVRVHASPACTYLPTYCIALESEQALSWTPCMP